MRYPFNVAAHVILAVLTIVFVRGKAQADEVKVESRIEAAGLFKNGLAVIERSAEISGPGVYRIEDVPTPVHGTYWIESKVPIETRVTMRDVESPAHSKSTIDFQQELIGHLVTIHLRDGQLPAVTGRVVELARPKGDEAWNRAYPQQRYYGGETPAQGQFLVLETPFGRAYVDTTQISFLEANGVGPTVRQRQPVLLLTNSSDTKEPFKVHISYLTRGLAWAPSYRVNLIDEKSMSIEQQATIKNELTDLTDTNLRLISGFPSVQFGHVTSPLALSQTWADFFAQLNSNPRDASSSAMANSASQQAAVTSNGVGLPGADFSPAGAPAEGGGDLHYQSIGKRTLAEGDSIALSVARAETTYERIVEWTVPDTRDVDGRFVDDYRRRDEPEKYQDAAWDAVRFNNPLSMAMTSAPAMVLDAGQFAGQRMSFWVNTGEQTTLQINKALSLRTQTTEQELQTEGDRQTVVVGGRNYRKVTVKGELTAANRRDRDINLVVRRQFSGDLVKADSEPKVVLREEGVYSVNRRNELTWSLPLKSGETRTLTYQYTVLVAE